MRQSISSALVVSAKGGINDHPGLNRSDFVDKRERERKTNGSKKHKLVLTACELAQPGLLDVTRCVVGEH